MLGLRFTYSLLRRHYVNIVVSSRRTKYKVKLPQDVGYVTSKINTITGIQRIDRLSHSRTSRFNQVTT